MRTRSSERRTLPSSTAVTPSERPISRTSAARPLNWKDEVREATCNPRTQHSALMISSAMPSQKYSWSRAALMSAKGRIATDGFPAPGRLAAAATAGCGASQAAAPSAGPAVVPGVPRDRASGAGVRSMPRGVTSNAHASPQASGNPSIASTITSRFAQVGKPIGSKVASATWIRSHAITM